MQKVLIVLNCSLYSYAGRFPIEFALLSGEMRDDSVQYLLLLPEANDHVIELASQLFEGALLVVKEDDYIFKYKSAYRFAVIVESDESLHMSSVIEFLRNLGPEEEDCYDAGVMIVNLQCGSFFDTFWTLLYSEACAACDPLSGRSDLYNDAKAVASGLRYALPAREVQACSDFVRRRIPAYKGRCPEAEMWRDLSVVGIHAFRLLSHEHAREMALQCGDYLKTTVSNPRDPRHSCTIFSQEGRLVWSSQGFFREGTADSVFAAFEELKSQRCDFLYCVRRSVDPNLSLYRLLAYVLDMRLLEVETAEFQEDDEVLQFQRAFFEEQQLFSV